MLGTVLAPFGLTPEWAQRLLTGALEISSGVWTLSGDGTLSGKLILAAFMLGWAGLSVHCQVLAFLGDSGLSLRTYLTGKLLHGGLSALFTALLVRRFPLERRSPPTWRNRWRHRQPGLSACPNHLHRGRLGRLAALCGTGRLYGEKKQWKTQAKESIMVPTTHWRDFMGLFQKKIEPRCTYCARGRALSEDQVICDRKGVMSAGSRCRSFKYDPLKRVPPRPAKADFSRLKDEDFTL